MILVLFIFLFRLYSQSFAKSRSAKLAYLKNVILAEMIETTILGFLLPETLKLYKIPFTIN